MDFITPRPVLFRAWNIEDKAFNVLPKHSREESAHHDLVINLEGNLLDYYCDEPYGSASYVDRKYVVTNYTGLVDKKGQKIFEGDIVQDTWNGKTAVVSAIETGWFPFHSEELYGGAQDFKPKGVNVIGNTFQNPELVGKALKAVTIANYDL